MAQSQQWRLCHEINRCFRQYHFLLSWLFTAQRLRRVHALVCLCVCFLLLFDGILAGAGTSARSLDILVVRAALLRYKLHRMIFPWKRPLAVTVSPHWSDIVRRWTPRQCSASSTNSLMGLMAKQLNCDVFSNKWLQTTGNEPLTERCCGSNQPTSL